MPARALLSSALLATLLFGCVSETRSIVSPQDIPDSKYQKIALFIENLPPPERGSAEQIVGATLRDAGINCLSSTDILKGRKLSPEQQGNLIRTNGFDAALFVTVSDKGAVEEPIEGAWYDFSNNEMHIDPISGVKATAEGYVVKSDGRVFYRNIVLKTKAELQDVNSGNPVWQSETIVTGHGQITSMTAMFQQAARQIVQKMRDDKAI